MLRFASISLLSSLLFVGCGAEKKKNSRTEAEASEDLQNPVVDESGNQEQALKLAAPEISAVPGVSVDRVSWNKIEGATSYILYWSLSPLTEFNFTVANRIEVQADSLGDTAKYDHQVPQNEVIYYYAITAHTDNLTSNVSNFASATPSNTLLDAAVANLTLTPGAGEVSISWDTVPGIPSFGISYIISWSQGGSNGILADATPPYKHTGLTPGLPYSYQVIVLVGATNRGTSIADVATPL